MDFFIVAEQQMAGLRVGTLHINNFFAIRTNTNLRGLE